MGFSMRNRPRSLLAPWAPLAPPPSRKNKKYPKRPPSKTVRSPRSPIFPVAHPGKKIYVPWVPRRAHKSLIPLGRDMGGCKTYGGEENVPENAPSRKFLDPSKRVSALLCRGFLYRKNRALTPEGVENVPYEGGSKTPCWEGCHS